MGEHEHLFDGVPVIHAYIGGFLFSIAAILGANMEHHVDILDWVMFSIGYVDFPVHSILTILGALSGATIAILGVRRALTQKQPPEPPAEATQ